MKKSFALFTLIFSTSFLFAQQADQLVAEVMDAMGGKQHFYNLGNVTYDYEYRAPNNSLTLVGKETYVFDGELSRGDYSKHSMLDANGKVLEGFDGQNAWVKFDGKLSSDEKANGVARFLRKTNYYWFTMFFKLQDEGVNLEHIGSKKVEGREYDLVKVTFGDKVGDAQDTYVLYINKRTKLVDQFLFTVIGFGVTEPNLMKVKYETINGIKIPTDRVYIASNWDGDILEGKEWTTTYWTNIRFNTKIDKANFSK
ncbi:MAG: DUF6503 family protein [Bacteroidota bacterium]